MKTQWEYEVLKLPVDRGLLSGTDFDDAKLKLQLNELGKEGWELVSITSIEKVRGGSKFMAAVLKRPVD